MFFEYCVKIYSKETYEETIHKGITFAKNYSEAMKNISIDYDEDTIIKVYLCGVAADEKIKTYDFEYDSCSFDFTNILDKEV